MAIQPLCSGSRSQSFFNEHQITLKYIELPTTFCVSNCCRRWERAHAACPGAALSDPPSRRRLSTNGTEHSTCTITTNY
ncbi:LOW QUALITY PROTEIN: hypothetical protein MSG28_008123, partial [Choristoneura fumiferana]